ncbi:OBG GTPase family GTP-binding protein [Candidatus Altiarchaeota archaeon]
MKRDEKISQIEEEIEKTSYNKATQHHIGKLKAKLAKLKEEEYKAASKKKAGTGFGVKKTGHATAVLIGLPSVGKSTLLNKITNADSEVGYYDFTTIDVIPGMMQHEKLNVQILDLPGIIVGASAGKGRGREILSMVRNADLVIIMLDPNNTRILKSIQKELYGVGVRMDERPPRLSIKKKIRGGITVTSPKKLKLISRDEIRAVLNEYGMHNADVIIREDVTVDKFIDAIAGNRVYVPSLILLNKTDLMEELPDLGCKYFPISADKGEGLDEVKDRIIRKIDVIRVYLKPQGGEADMDDPLILKKGSRVKDLCVKLHKDFLNGFRYAQIWGESAKHPGQHAGLRHVLKDQDVITVIR